MRLSCPLIFFVVSEVLMCCLLASPSAIMSLNSDVRAICPLSAAMSDHLQGLHAILAPQGIEIKYVIEFLSLFSVPRSGVACCCPLAFCCLLLKWKPLPQSPPLLLVFVCALALALLSGMWIPCRCCPPF